MDDSQKRVQEMTQAVAELNRQELIPDWELLFWTFSDRISLGVR
jgi:hypothetical protein